jgi:hypothetical protein
LSAHLVLACAQFFASALQPSHTSFHTASAPLGDRPIKASIQSRFGKWYHARRCLWRGQALPPQGDRLPRCGD